MPIWGVEDDLALLPQRAKDLGDEGQATKLADALFRVFSGLLGLNFKFRKDLRLLQHQFDR